jgi:hypothetical protein
MALQIFQKAFEALGKETTLQNNILEISECRINAVSNIAQSFIVDYRIDVLIAKHSKSVAVVVNRAEDINNPRIYVTSLTIWVAKSQFDMEYRFERISSLEQAVSRLGNLFIFLGIDSNLFIDTYNCGDKIKQIYEKQLIHKLIAETDNIRIVLTPSLQLDIEVRLRKRIISRNTNISDNPFLHYCITSATGNSISNVPELERPYQEQQ